MEQNIGDAGAGQLLMNLAVTYFTGSSGPSVEARASLRPDIGLMVTPLKPDYLAKVGLYKSVAVDNGVFSRVTPFSAANFERLLDDVAATCPEKVRFAVAPDVVGDSAATLAQFPAWAPKIRARGLPVAFAAQDGAEGLPIPWDDFDVLFIGGSTEWKTGSKFHGPRGVDWQGEWRWIRMFREAGRRGKAVHVGRVNSGIRLEIAHYGLGAASVDGTFLAYGPDLNLPELESWLNEWNGLLAPKLPVLKPSRARPLVPTPIIATEGRQMSLF